MTKENSHEDDYDHTYDSNPSQEKQEEEQRGIDPSLDVVILPSRSDFLPSRENTIPGQEITTQQGMINAATVRTSDGAMDSQESNNYQRKHHTSLAPHVQEHHSVSHPKRFQRTMCFLILITVAIIIALVAFLYLFSDSDDSVDDSGLAISSDGDDSVDDSASDSVDDSTDNPESPKKELQSFLAEASYDSGEAIYDEFTPQYNAVMWLADDSNLDTYTKPEKIQRFVLATLFFVAGGDDWTNIQGWLDHDTNECSWDSIVCNSDNQIQEINMEAQNLKGEIPPELGMLSDSLVALILKENNLSGTIPPELGSLLKVQVLQLTDNDLTGGIPEELGGLSNIIELDLGHNLLEGQLPAKLGDLITVHTIDLENNQLSGRVPPELGLLSNSLQLLNMASNDLDGSIPLELGNLHLLEVLQLTSNELIGEIPTELGQLGSIIELGLGINNLGGKIPKELGDLVTVHTIGLEHNQITGTIPPEFRKLKELRHLALDWNNLHSTVPAELGELKKLKSVHLSENNLVGSIPAPWCQLADLLDDLAFDCSEIACDCCSWCPSWKRLGNDIVSDRSRFGADIELSEDGLVLGINDDEAVQIMGYSSGSWNQLGDKVCVDYPDNECWEPSGLGDLALSGDGKVFGVGHSYSRSSYAEVYQNTANLWTRMGDTHGAIFVGSLSLSSDGMVFAMATNDGYLDTGRGDVTVSRFVNDTWDLLGQVIDCQTPYSVSLSGNGKVMAMSDASNTVQLYELKDGMWELKQGGTIEIARALVVLSRDGNTLAMTDSSYENPGGVKVLRYTSNGFHQLGADFPGDGSKVSLSLSNDGSSIAIGTPRLWNYQEKVGKGQVFHFQDNEWKQVGQTISCEIEGEQEGTKVSISGNGNIFAFSCMSKGGAGKVQVFQFS